jgi:hypothetical protein
MPILYKKLGQENDTKAIMRTQTFKYPVRDWGATAGNLSYKVVGNWSEDNE